ncbi:MAG: amidohydrolase family protein [Myxococcales bacterium]|nr:D-aminoacylase [Myxococcales bacterium]
MVILLAVLDLLIVNARVVDGTGAPWFRADVGVQGDRIVQVGNLKGEKATRTIDAKDRMLAPGFIDMLGQSELFGLVDPRVESKVRQGITTEITGEGESAAPVTPAILAEGKPWLDKYKLKVDWTDFAGFQKRWHATSNLASFVGAATLREAVLGYGEVQPTPEQLAQMEKLCEQAMQQGALGVSTALIYAPASYAKTSEIVALAKVAARYGGVYATHIRGEADTVADGLDEAIEIGREARIPVEIWHFKVAGRNNWGRMKESIARIEKARASGVDVSANMYPYTAAGNGLSAQLPGWALAGGTEATLARLKDPAQRAKIVQDPWFWHGGLGSETPDGILIAYIGDPRLQRYVGKRVSEIAAEEKKSPEDAILDLLIADRLQTGVVRFVMSEDDVRLGWRQPWVSLGTDNPGFSPDGPFADVSLHPRGWGSTPRVLAMLGIEEGVRRLTSLPARRAGLMNRGILRPGMMADLVMFDPAALRDLATYEQPRQFAAGFDDVIVNGKLVIDEGKLTAERPGRALRRSLDTAR